MRLNRTAQQGAVFLALVLVLFVSGSTLMLGALNNRQTTALAQQSELHYQMERAKASLLAYAGSTANLFDNARGPGYFPCPDTNNDGLPEANCDTDSALVGRLPEYETIGSSRFMFNDAYAGIGQQFWYVVAPRYVWRSVKDDKRRSRTRTSSDYGSGYWLTLDNESEYVAFIIAPGEELTTQNRSTGPTDYANYLDGLNGSSDFDFYTSYSSNPELFNDQIIGITRDEFMLYTGAAVASAVKEVMDEYNAIYGIYPQDSSSCCTFRNQFDDEHAWLIFDFNDGNGERWSSTSYGLTWDRNWPNQDMGTVYFYGCSGLSFTMTYGGGITRTGSGC